MPLLSLDNTTIMNLRKAILTSAEYLGLADRFMYCPFMAVNAVLGSASSLAPNVLRVIPFVLTAKVQLESAALIPISGGGLNVTKFRFGIYSSDPLTRLPKSLVWQSSELLLTNYNKAYILSGLEEIVLDGGMYYFAVLTDAKSSIVKGITYTTPVVFQGFPAYFMPQVIGFDTANGFNPVVRLESAFVLTAAGLPAFFPSVYTFQSVSNSSPELFLIKTGVLPLM